MVLFIISLLLCFGSITATPVSAARPRFSDEFARTKVVPLCAATEGDSPQRCLSRSFQNATYIRKITVKCDKLAVDTCSGYTAINHADKAIVIAFRGSLGLLQVAAETAETVFDAKVPWIAGGSVSKYFYDAFTSVWNGGIKDDFLMLSNKFKNYELWIVGHSLGGAMASLTASYIVKAELFDRNRIKLVTFGQPRTGDVAFAKAHGEQIPYAFRVTHARDLIPHIPPTGLKDYHHHKTEVFYNNDMTTSNFTECDEEQSNGCSNLITHRSFIDHHRYFNVFISRWGAAGCIGDPVNPPVFRH